MSNVLLFSPESSSDIKASRSDWSRGQNFGLGLGVGLDKLASASVLASSIWPRPDHDLVNLASKNVVSNVK